MKSYYIHLIRHGITASNLQNKYIGITDVPLCEEGKEKLLYLRDNYTYPRATAVFTSPLKRCVQTAELLYPGCFPITVNDLRECNFGEWEGKSAAELAGNAEFTKWVSEGGKQVAPPGGESSSQMAYRVCKAFETLVEGLMKSGTTESVIITHGVVIMTILSMYGLPKAEFYEWMTANGCGYTLKITPSLWMSGNVAEVIKVLPDGISEKPTKEVIAISKARERAFNAAHPKADDLNSINLDENK